MLMLRMIENAGVIAILQQLGVHVHIWCIVFSHIYKYIYILKALNWFLYGYLAGQKYVLHRYMNP